LPDYAISCVTYDKHDRNIASVGVRPYSDFDAKPDEWTRAEVLKAMDAGKTFTTIRLGTKGKYEDGALIHPLKVGSHRFISTNADETTADNLGSIHTPCPDLDP
jgi:hypothetical protein